MREFIVFLSFPIMTALAEAKPRLESDLPTQDFTVLESSSKVRDPSVRITKESGLIRLQSNLSQAWGMGLSFHLDDLSLTIPFVGFSSGSFKNNSYLWKISDSGPSHRKEGSVSIRRSSNGCTMDWSFHVTIRGEVKVKEHGSIGYSCSGGKWQNIAQSPQPVVPANPPKPQITDFLPGVQTGLPSATVGHQIRSILDLEGDALRSCVQRNLNRPATLKDENHYSAPPRGNLVYRISAQNGKVSTTPQQTANDVRMDSCVIDLVNRVDMAKVEGFKEDGSKFLVFDIDCSTGGENVQEKYKCRVKFDVYDKVSS